MRVVLQRVARASVSVEGERVATIDRGLLLLVGIAPGDDAARVDAAAAKIAGLRVFEDAEGRMNLDLAQAGGAVLVVSQFTLLASTEKGRRPSFEGAATPAQAAPLVDRLVLRLRDAGLAVATGRFGAHMRIELVNDGPVTLVMDFPARA
jgi:D-tyrosyl-tRNA(Tyr) deacylase